MPHYTVLLGSMTILNRKEPLILLLGDVVFLCLALWLALLVRYLRLPNMALLRAHFLPFSFIFLVWILVFFIAGLYERQTVILKSRQPAIIFQSQITNSVIAVIFFYFIPYFLITPKTNLFIDLVFSFILIIFWRLFLYNKIVVRRAEKAILMGSGNEMRELKEEAHNNPHSLVHFVSVIDLEHSENFDFETDILQVIYNENITTVVIDLHNSKSSPLLPHLYNLLFSKVQFVDMHTIYEDIFNRIPLSLVKYSWFLENISAAPNVFYEFLKRLMDLLISIPIGLISLILYPFIALAIWLDDGRPIFIRQDRIGKDNRRIKIVKFRTMRVVEGIDLTKDLKQRITRVGNFLRKTRLDEIPQIWSVVHGEQSLIGPRPELPVLVDQYEKQISYYAVRHLIKPGLSGWAQLYHDNHPHHGLGVEQTKEKLSYDLFYIKNRSFVLDFKVALKTIKKLLSIAGA